VFGKGMGIAAPQIGIGRAAALVRTPAGFDGIRRLPAMAPPLLGLAAPVRGAAIGWVALGQSLPRSSWPGSPSPSGPSPTGRPAVRQKLPNTGRTPGRPRTITVLTSAKPTVRPDGGRIVWSESTPTSWHSNRSLTATAAG
jgi:hypothetical protein